MKINKNKVNIAIKLFLSIQIVHALLKYVFTCIFLLCM